MNARLLRSGPRIAAEAVVLAMVCAGPWALGAVPAWAQLGLAVGTAAVAILIALGGEPDFRGRAVLCGPSLALAALVGLGLWQATPLPNWALRIVAPGAARIRSELLPAGPERVISDPGPTVPLPPTGISQDRDATIQTVIALAGAWVLFQGVLGLGGDPRIVRRLAIALSWNSTALALFSIIQALTWNGRIYWVFPSHTDGWAGGGPFACHTHLAEYLNMGLGLAMGLALPGGWRGIHRVRGARLWAIYSAGLIVAGVVTSNSRGGFLAMLGAG